MNLQSQITAANAPYLPGFGNHVSTEAVPGALPVGRNSPQKPPFGLYAEQLSGTAFRAPRHENRRSWLYRLRPSAEHPPYTRYQGAKRFAPGTVDEPLPPNRLRWDPIGESAVLGADQIAYRRARLTGAPRLFQPRRRGLC